MATKEGFDRNQNSEKIRKKLNLKEETVGEAIVDLLRL